MTENELEEAASYAMELLEDEPKTRFELSLGMDPGLAVLIDQLRDAVVDFGLEVTAAKMPSAVCKEMLLSRLDPIDRPNELFGSEPHPIVITDADGLLQWINPAFTRMCGYELAELRGKKPGALLQGELTDPVVTRRMGEAIRTRSSSRETLINYRKDGTPYWVDCAITPVLGPGGGVCCFIAQEQELVGRPIPTS